MTNADGYKVYRINGDGSHTLLSTISNPQTTWYTDVLSASAPDSSYYITTYNAAGESTSGKTAMQTP